MTTTSDRPLRGLIHAHTWHSFDSLLVPAAYLWYARRAHLDFLAITDHNSLAGARAVAASNRDPDLEIVLGAEYATERHDVIGLFLTEEVISRVFEEVIAEIHAQGGIAILPHPYRGRDSDTDRILAVDLVESFNARSSADANAAALADATRLRRGALAGADIHTTWELMHNGTLVTLQGTGPLRKRLIDGPRVLETKPAPRMVRRYSQIIKRARARIGLPGHA
jgi:predicted metal-dependent phosphoesterase TrpH